MNKLIDYYKKHSFSDKNYLKHMTSEELEEFLSGVERLKQHPIETKKSREKENISPPQIDEEYLQHLLDNPPTRMNNNSPDYMRPPNPTRTKSVRMKEIRKKIRKNYEEALRDGDFAEALRVYKFANSSSRGGLHKYKSRHTKRRYRKTQKRHK